MSFESITRSYLRNFQQACVDAYSGGAKSIELATRPCVHQYIKNLVDLCKRPATDILIHHDTNYTSTDRPDWRIEDKISFGVFCFGDHKSLLATGPFQPNASEKRQIKRYLSLGRPVFVFDGIEFIFYSHDLENPTRLEVVPKPLLALAQKWHSLPIDSRVEAVFRRLLENPGFRKWSEAQLVDQLARRARIIADEMAMLLGAPLGSGVSEIEEQLLRALQQLREIIAEHHDPSLRDDRACADFIAQVLTFGLFYAHTRFLIALSNPEERRLAITRFWSSEHYDAQPNLLRPFKTIIDALSLAEPEASGNVLADWYSQIQGVLAHAEYMGTEPGPQDFHALFEQFYVTFDERARFDRGVFYTPKILTEWIARASNKLSIAYFHRPIMEVADKIIDPCCGTGGFLEAIYTQGGGSAAQRQPELVGFEILPAPYVLAHYRMSEILAGSSNRPELKILLTDTLSDQLQELPDEEENGFNEELREAVGLCSPPIRLVLGNPPSSNHPASSAPRTIIENMLEDFRPPKSERTDRQNTQKALNNEAYRFLRWCSQRVLESKRGILALVLPGAFARAVSFQYARYWLLRNFQDIFILELDADARGRDVKHSLFSVLQGRLLIFGVQRPLRPASKSSVTTLADIANVFYFDIRQNTVAKKIEFLESDVQFENFTKLLPDEPQWRLAPSAAYPIDLWSQCWPLTSTRATRGIFLSKCSALKLAPTSMLFHTHSPTLLRRSKDIGADPDREGNEPNELIARWFSGQRRPPAAKKFTAAVRLELGKAARARGMTRYLFRPFLNGWVFNNDTLFEALSSAPGGGTRARPEIRAAFGGGAVGIAVAPAPCDLGSTLTRFACFAWNLPDNDIAARGNAMLYCDRFPEKGPDGLGNLVENIDSKMLDLFSFSDDPRRAVLFYVYAVLSSSSYLDTFEGVLYGPSDPNAPCRIPIAATQRVRQLISKLGQEIAVCEQGETAIDVDKSLSFVWPHEVTDFKLVRTDYVDEQSCLLLIGESDLCVKINGVPADVAALNIAGHNVLDKWLRERHFAYLRRNFNADDLKQTLFLITRIVRQLSIVKVVDRLVERMLKNEHIVPTLDSESS